MEFTQLDCQEYSEVLEDKPQLQVECYLASAPMTDAGAVVAGKANTMWLRCLRALPA